MGFSLNTLSRSCNEVGHDGKPHCKSFLSEEVCSSPCLFVGHVKALFFCCEVRERAVSSFFNLHMLPAFLGSKARMRTFPMMQMIISLLWRTELWQGGWRGRYGAFFHSSRIGRCACKWVFWSFGFLLLLPVRGYLTAPREEKLTRVRLYCVEHGFRQTLPISVEHDALHRVTKA